MDELKPMSFGEMLDTAFLIFRKSYLHFLIMAAVVGLVSLAYKMFMFSQFSGVGIVAAPQGGSTQGLLIAFLGNLYYLISIFFTGAVIIFTSAYYAGEPLSIGASFKRALSRYLPLLGIALIAGLATTVGLVLIIIPGVIVLTYVSFAMQVLLLERAPIIPSFRRSLQLVRGRGFWILLGLLVTAILVVEGANIILDIPFSAAGHFLWGTSARASALGHFLSSFVTTALFGAFPAILMTVAYYDARVRADDASTT